MSEIRATTISNAAGTGPITMTGQSAAKAFAAFDQTGTQSIRNSQNISSITDVNVGISAFAITSSFVDANWAHVACSGENAGGGNRIVGLTGAYGALTASSVTFRNFTFSSVSNDDNRISFALLGDLA